MKLYKAILHTGGKTREQIINMFDGPEPTDAEIASTEQFYKLLDGASVILTDGINGEGYSLALWPKEENSRIKEATFLLEQDSLFGCYINQRKEFDLDWDSGEYSPDGVICFDSADVEIIKIIQK